MNIAGITGITRCSHMTQLPGISLPYVYEKAKSETCCSNGTAWGLRGPLTEIRSAWPSIENAYRFTWGEAGFASPEICETNFCGVWCSLCVPLEGQKNSQTGICSSWADGLILPLSTTKDTVELFGAFEYQAGPRDNKCRTLVSEWKKQA